MRLTMIDIEELNNKLTQLEQKYNDLATRGELFKNNSLNFLCLNSDKLNLYYIKTPTLLFIFSDRSFTANTDFTQGYVIEYLKKRGQWNFGKLKESSLLYKEHYEEFKYHNILFYKYIDRDGLINKSIVSQDKETGEIYVESQYIGKEYYNTDDGNVIYADQPKRKVIKGTIITQYLSNKTLEEKRLIMRNVFDYLFSNYPAKSQNKNKVSGVLLDAHFANILVNDDGFHFIDKDIISEHDLSKSQFLYRVLKTTPHYHYFLSYYNLDDESKGYLKSYPLELRNTKNMQLLRTRNKYLLDKYFGDSGFSAREDFKVKLNVVDKDYPQGIVDMFDSAWYEKMYPDFRLDCPNISGSTALYHYMNIGWKKGFNPSLDFDGVAYLEHHEGVKKANVNPLWHYVTYGKKEGREIFKVSSSQ